MSIGSLGLTGQHLVEAIGSFYGNQALTIFQNCNFAMPGSSVIGNINSQINTVNELSPKLALILREGFVHQEINQKLAELTQEIANLKSVSTDEKPSVLKKVVDTVNNIKEISEGVEHLKPYAKVLYSGAKAALNLDLPDWQ